MQVTIIKTGGKITLQDQGREQVQAYGFSPGGAADLHSMLWANKLLNNTASNPVFECTLGNMELEFSSSCSIAVTGAANHIEINGQIKPAWQCHTLDGPSRVTIDPPRSGIYTYIAVKGELRANKILNSYSTVEREESGFNAGHPLNTGQTLEFIIHRKSTLPYAVPYRFRPDYSENLPLRLIPGFQFSQCQQDQIQNIFDSHYTVHPNSNKMGYRLTGGKPIHIDSTILSEATPLGSVQIPPDGNPIILMKDRQTIGGYPKLGCIYQTDIFQLSQRRPGQKVAFQLGNLSEAEEELRQLYRFLR
ncbi:biotin-dependent carboxyltransferase family protein [Teredinibacter sp. KSP-S5-2]|uniref:5-oxoprolinase subunit C family protein n=1 Tax=Teredinibacter sp. KSP-S5-2 TaxID=3034506 RepID=UPI00293419DB|nr:biotin-dependent carboxyltransferase family protein [Teredinibacter sp. KSP-S5-2]WNO08755.1 biotin-dependent carboxyltransferase family protein [Teredinibacter sp. KSP-S5-2]